MNVPLFLILEQFLMSSENVLRPAGVTSGTNLRADRKADDQTELRIELEGPIFGWAPLFFYFKGSY